MLSVSVFHAPSRISAPCGAGRTSASRVVRLERRGLASIVALWATACVSHEVTRIDLTQIEGVTPPSVFILSIERGESFDVIVIDGASGAGFDRVPAVQDYDGSFSVTYSVLVLEGTVEQLELTPGLVDVSPTGRRAPGGDVVHRRVARADHVSQWEAVPRAESVFADLRSEAFGAVDTDCDVLSPRTVELDTIEPIASVVALADGTALVITGRRATAVADPPSPTASVFRVTTSSVTKLDGLIPNYATTIGRGRIISGFEDSTGTLWFQTADWLFSPGDRHFYRGTLEGGFTEMSRPDSDSAIRWMVGPPDAGAGAIFGLNDVGGLERYDVATDRWLRIVDNHIPWGQCVLLNVEGPDRARALHFCGAMYWLDGNRMLVHSPNGIGMWIYDAVGGVAPTLVAGSGNAPLRASARTPLGLVASTSSNGLTDFFLFSGTRLEPLELTVPTQPTFAIAPHRRGFIFTGSFGFITQFAPGRSSGPICEGQTQFVSPLRPFYAVPMPGDRFMLVGFSPTERPLLSIVTITPQS